MAMQPGPRQVFPANISRISFPSLGGLLFLRVQQTYSGKIQGPSPSAQLTWEKLPWDNFDIFTAVAAKDPDNRDASTSIVNPVSDKMLQQYRYWAPKPKQEVNETKTTPGIEVWFVDTALWYGVYKTPFGFMEVNAGYGPHDQTLEELWRAFIDRFIDPSLFVRENFSIKLAPHLRAGNNFFTETPYPPSPLFYEVAAAVASQGQIWTWHSEPGPPYILYTKAAYAVLTVNLAKAFKDLPLVNGKKPLSFKFRIDMAQGTPNTANTTLNWDMSAFVYSTKVSKPPQPDDGRLDFPLADTPIPLTPTWDDPTGGTGGGLLNPVNGYVIVTVTFGVGKVKPKVEVETFGGSGSTEG